jgi:hypothetical protein
MPTYVKSARFRKFTAVDREYPIFELVADDEVLLDISASDEGVLEVALHAGGANKLFLLDQLMEWIAEGKKLVEAETETAEWTGKGDVDPSCTS